MQQLGANERIKTPEPWGLVWSAVAALPALKAGFRAVRDGWVPLSDEAVIATRSFDVLSSRSPVLGQLSTVGLENAAGARSPGPLPYWLFALSSRVGPTWVTAAFAALLAAVGSVLVVRLARRRGGLPLMAATAVGLVLCARAYDPVNLASPWNPSVGLVPMVLLFFLCWSAVAGERWLLVPAVAVASLLGQAHLTYLFSAVGLLTVTVVLMALGWVAEPGSAEPRSGRAWRGEEARAGRGEKDVAASIPARVRGVMGPVLAAAVAGLLAWSLPLGQQVFGRRGNLSLLLDAANGPVLGWWQGWRVLGWSFGMSPAFAQPATDPAGFFDRLPSSSWSVTSLSAALMVVGLAAMVVAGVQRSRPDIAVPAVLVLVMVVGAAFVARSTPDDVRALSLVYSTWWMIELGMLVWLVLGLGLATLAGQRLRALGANLPPGVGTAMLAVVAVLAVAVGLTTSTYDREAHVFPAALRVGDAVVANTEPEKTYLVDVSGPLAIQLGPGVGYRLRRSGSNPVVDGVDGENMGRWYEPSGRRCDGIVRIVGDTTGPLVVQEGERQVATIEVDPGDTVEDRTVVVLIVPDIGTPSC